MAQVKKSRLEDLRDDAENSSFFFHELSRELKKKRNNPLYEQSESIARAAHRLNRKIDAFLEKLEDEGLVSGR